MGEGTSDPPTRMAYERGEFDQWIILMPLGPTP